MSVIITGSVAYDYLMFFPGRFRDHILPDQIDKLSLSFLVESMQRQRGGCAPNIAYSLALLGERPVVMAAVGPDFTEYGAWLKEVGVDTSAILVVDDQFTSSFFVNTDQENNQIASFYMGAMGAADRLSFHNLDYKAIDLAIISPNAPAAMTKYVRECRELGVPYIYDPSQQIIWLKGDELVEGAEGARVLIVNEYEFGMIKNKTGLSDEELLALPEVTIITLGEKGSTIYADHRLVNIPVVPPAVLADPTGVGDAYRAGIIKGMIHGYPWVVTGQVAALAATYVLEQFGTQSHAYTRAEFVARYRQVFGDVPQLKELAASSK
ncbi:MAG: carbohydrate kinase family protein [Anaerolineae bacterium]|nr:carbohydrate kinase family protein [Anaerolineae bacterium]